MNKKIKKISIGVSALVVFSASVVSGISVGIVNNPINKLLPNKLTQRVIYDFKGWFDKNSESSNNKLELAANWLDVIFTSINIGGYSSPKVGLYEWNNRYKDYSTILTPRLDFKWGKANDVDGEISIRDIYYKTSDESFHLVNDTLNIESSAIYNRLKFTSLSAEFFNAKIYPKIKNSKTFKDIGDSNVQYVLKCLISMVMVPILTPIPGVLPTLVAAGQIFESIGKAITNLIKHFILMQIKVYPSMLEHMYAMDYNARTSKWVDRNPSYEKWNIESKTILDKSTAKYDKFFKSYSGGLENFKPPTLGELGDLGDLSDEQLADVETSIGLFTPLYEILRPIINLFWTKLLVMTNSFLTPTINNSINLVARPLYSLLFGNVYALIENIWINNTKFSDFVIYFFKTFDKVQGTIENIKDFIKELIDKIKDLIGNIKDKINEIINKLKDLSKFIEDLINKIELFFADFKNNLEKLILRIYGDVIKKIEEIYNKIIEEIKEYIQSIKDKIIDAYNKLIEDIKKLSEEQKKELIKWLEDNFEIIKNLILKKLFDDFAIFIGTTPEHLESIIKEIISKIESIKDISKKIKEIIEYLKPKPGEDKADMLIKIFKVLIEIIKASGGNYVVNIN